MRRRPAGCWTRAGPRRPGVVETLSDIVADAKRASQVIRRLRALFRREHVDRHPVDVNELIQEVVRLLRHDTERQRISVQCALPLGLPKVPGDPVQIQQVLLNLLLNAREAIAAGESGPREIRIETREYRPGGVAVAIRDSGIGASEAELERMFEHFVTTGTDGLGYGPRHQPVDHPGAWRPHLGRRQP